jgi:hypothetical protein
MFSDSIWRKLLHWQIIEKNVKMFFENSPQKLNGRGKISTPN